MSYKNLWKGCFHVDSVEVKARNQEKKEQMENFKNMSLRELLAKASPLRSGDVLAGIAAASEEERARARYSLLRWR